MRFDIGEAANLEIGSAVEPALAAFVRAQLRPYRAMPSPASDPAAADVVLTPTGGAAAGVGSPETEPGSTGESHWGTRKVTFVDVENDAGDGLATAWDGERAYVLRLGRWCAVPDALLDHPAVFEYERGFPVWDIWGSLVGPALSLSALRHDAVVVHASAVEIDGRAILVGGWSESGKTEVALALAETGAKFISDKWSVVRGDATVVPFPASVGVRRWVVRYLPRLRSRLSVAARTQLAGAAVAGTLASPIRRRSYSRRLLREAAGFSDRVTAVADRVSISSAEVRAIYGGSLEEMCKPVPLATVVLLSTVPNGGGVDPVDASIVARRLARAAAFERRAYFSVGERVAYAAHPFRRSSAVEVAGLEESLLGRVLRDAIVLEGRTVFPADPRRLADAIRRVGT